MASDFGNLEVFSGYDNMAAGLRFSTLEVAWGCLVASIAPRKALVETCRGVGPGLVFAHVVPSMNRHVVEE
jgi:hypothetical protein